MVAAQKSLSVEFVETDIGAFECGIVGITPFLHNRMAEKARQELLFPKGRKNAAEKASSMKHEPLQEFRSSPYTLPDDDGPTFLAIMASMFKGAMSTAALDLPGSSRAQIGRLVWVEGHYLPMWGDVKLHMGVTRSADIGGTPDIRTRAISPHWGTVITVSYVQPMITGRSVANLLRTAGKSAGVGDWRPQKGKGTFGQFRVCDVDDPDLLAVQKYDRAIQSAAMAEADPYDPETAELLSWFEAERVERGR